MKKIICLLACCSGILSLQKACAQAPAIEWAYVYPDYIGSGTCTEPTSDGGYIVGGVFASHFLAIKLDGAGTEQWHRWISSGTGVTAVNAIKQTTDSGYIVAGSDFTTSAPDSIGNHGIRDFMITKLDQDGVPVWIKCLGGSLNEEAQSIEQTPDGGYIVAGYASSGDGDVTGWHGNWDYWVVKLDSTGNITWQKTLGGTLYDYATSVVPTTDGGYVVAGYSGSKDGDVTGTHWGSSDDDVWVIKLNASGNIAWQKSYGGSKEDHANSIRQTSDGGYIVAGSTMSSDGDITGKHGTAYDNQDYWVMKLDASGNMVWQKCLGGSGSGSGAGSGNDIAYGVRQTTDGGYVVAGTVSSGTATNDDITGYHGTTGADYWIVKLDAVGNLSWQKCLGGSGTEDARSIAQTTDGGYIVAGTTVNSPDGDVGTSNFGYDHPWVVKLLNGPSGIVEAASDFSLVVYPNPANASVTIANVPAGSMLKIIDLAGHVVCHSNLTRTHETISTAGLVNGVYIIRVMHEGTFTDRKLIVSK